jgi:23S rRNA U2552 (ribose-2'-O)-methylase RlmE/FtsJ
MRDGHCNAAWPDPHLEPTLKTFVGFASTVRCPMPDGDTLLAKPFAVMRRDCASASDYNHRFARARRNYHCTSSIGDGNWRCRSALKTIEILHTETARPITSAFTLGGPGGEVEVLQTYTDARINIMTLRGNNNDYPPSLSRACYRVHGDDYSGDITTQSASVVREMSERHPTGVDFVGMDAANDDTHSVSCHRDDPTLLAHEFAVAYCITSRLGFGYVKVLDPSSDRTARIISAASVLFGSVRLLKLRTSRTATFETHVVFRCPLAPLNIRDRTRVDIVH